MKKQERTSKGQNLRFRRVRFLVIVTCILVLVTKAVSIHRSNLYEHIETKTSIETKEAVVEPAIEDAVIEITTEEVLRLAEEEK